MKTSPPPPDSDVCLILEGTYPYVSGGVSTWVHDFINDCPQLRFSIFFIGSRKEDFPEPKYTVPENVVCLSEIYLFGDDGGLSAPAKSRRRGSRKDALLIGEMTARFLAEGQRAEDRPDCLLNILLEAKAPVERWGDFDAFWNHPNTWERICELYTRYAPGEAFGNFFWTARNVADPLWKLLQALDSVPRADLYHSLCTGYAGLVGALVARIHDAPLLLSEHGIYAKERLEEIRKTTALPETPDLHPSLLQDFGFLKRLWIGYFKTLAEVSYSSAGGIVSLFDRNAQVQRELGAPAEKIDIVPNGIDPSLYDSLLLARKERRKRRAKSKTVGFLGRIVPIKDVKCLLRAARIVVSDCPEARFQITGSYDEDPAYYQECVNLADQLHLADNVVFTGPMDKFDFLAEIDVMVLTSLSEGLPFAILEAFAAGIPVVSTDVGACGDLIESGGSAGFVAEIGNHSQIAQGLLRLLNEPELREHMGTRGRMRVESQYLQRDIVREYRALYDGLLSPKPTPADTSHFPAIAPFPA